MRIMALSPVPWKAFKKDGKLYGLPRNTDVAASIIMRKCLRTTADVPATYDELLDLAQKISGAGITPLAMDGGDGWPMAIYLSDILFKLTGDYTGHCQQRSEHTGDFTDPAFKQATGDFKKRRRTPACSRMVTIPRITERP